MGVACGNCMRCKPHVNDIRDFVLLQLRVYGMDTMAEGTG